MTGRLRAAGEHVARPVSAGFRPDRTRSGGRLRFHESSQIHDATTATLSGNATGNVAPGTPVTFTLAASDVASGLPAPGGIVELIDDSTSTPKLLAAFPVTDGQATDTTRPRAAGSRPIQAVFETGTDDPGSRSNVVTVTLT